MSGLTYIIKYTAYNVCDVPIKCGTIKVKNKLTEMHAKASLHDYLKKKLPYFRYMVIDDCKEDEGVLGNIEELMRSMGINV